MGVRWNPKRFRLPSTLILIILFSQIQGYWTVNPEGLALLEFKAGVYSDPDGALVNWDPNDNNPCSWSGVRCNNGKVNILDLTGRSLEGTVSPELGKLSHLKSLLLSKNCFFDNIPKEIGTLTALELLDLRENNLSGEIPAELGGLISLKRLLLCGNALEGSIPPELDELSLLSDLQFDENLLSSPSPKVAGINRKFGHCIWQNRSRQQKMAEASASKACSGINLVADSSKLQAAHNLESDVNVLRRKLLEESSNLESLPANVGAMPVSSVLVTRSSGSFPAVPRVKKAQQPSPVPPSVSSVPQSDSNPNYGQSQPSSHGPWNYVMIIVPSIAVLLLIGLVICVAYKKKGAKTITPWKTGISGQLQKAFITGVPKLNRGELETACEDFSNIISSLDGSVVYKGTLSSGVEIAVTSTAVSALKDWGPNVEKAYRKRIDMLSRVNHKNFVNLIGYCEENEPFTRMMVFEYAPNGTLYEHLHVKEAEHLDWITRVRIIMGIAYCLQYMHHEINPPVSHSSINSTAIFLTDDYAAKIAEVNIWSGPSPKPHDDEDDKSTKSNKPDKSVHKALPPMADPETNVYDFGLLLLEIISGKLPFSEENGSLVDLATEHVKENRSFRYLIDPSLKSFKDNELDHICEVIKDCLTPDSRHRPTMKEVTSKLKEVIAIAPEQAVPRLSPLWWAELEILSVEAA